MESTISPRITEILILEKSLDTLGYQMKHPGDVFTLDRVFALREGQGYRLHRYVYGGFPNRILGLPSEVEGIGYAESKEKARERLKRIIKDKSLERIRIAEENSRKGILLEPYIEVNDNMD